MMCILRTTEREHRRVQRAVLGSRFLTSMMWSQIHLYYFNTFHQWKTKWVKLVKPVPGQRFRGKDKTQSQALPQGLWFNCGVVLPMFQGICWAYSGEIVTPQRFGNFRIKADHSWVAPYSFSKASPGYSCKSSGAGRDGALGIDY